jgi:hypothetical protein
MLWVEMVYTKATERSLSPWYITLSTLLSHVLLQSISHEEDFSTNNAILAASYELCGRIVMWQRKKKNENATVGREWGNLEGHPQHSWDLFPSLCYSGKEERL